MRDAITLPVCHLLAKCVSGQCKTPANCSRLWQLMWSHLCSLSLPAASRIWLPPFTHSQVLPCPQEMMCRPNMQCCCNGRARSAAEFGWQVAAMRWCVLRALCRKCRLSASQRQAGTMNCKEHHQLGSQKLSMCTMAIR